MTDHDVILGRLICDHLGLDPNRFTRELTLEQWGDGGTTTVSLTYMNTISAEDMAELRTLANARVLAGEGPVG